MATLRRPDPTPPAPDHANRPCERDRHLIEKVADIVDAAIDATSWAESVDLLLDLDDLLHRVLGHAETVA